MDPEDFHRCAAIFDMDGVLLRTDEYHFQSWHELAAAYGIAFSRQTFDLQMRGLERPAALRVFLGDAQDRFTMAQQAQLSDEKQQRFLDIVRRRGVDPLPGVLELMADLRRYRTRIGVGSSSRNTQFLLEMAGLANRVDVVVDANDCRGKPAPDIFLEVARRLKVAPQDCVVIEDALDGIEAARRASMAVLAIGPAERFDAAVDQVTTLEGVTAAWLLGLISSQGQG